MWFGWRGEVSTWLISAECFEARGNSYTLPFFSPANAHLLNFNMSARAACNEHRRGRAESI